MTPVTSSNIEAVGYDQASKRLTVKFKSGTTCSYADVPENVHAALMSAKSIGSYFHKHVRSVYARADT